MEYLIGILGILLVYAGGFIVGCNGSYTNFGRVITGGTIVAGIGILLSVMIMF